MPKALAVIYDKQYHKDTINAGKPVPSNTQQTKQPVRQAHIMTGTTIDGFTRVSRGTALRPVASLKKPLTPKPSAIDVRKPHAPAINALAHKPQPATTLMRSAVKKPDLKAAGIIKAHSRTDILSKVPVQTIIPKMSYNSVNKPRHERAERMIKSPVISRYARPMTAAPKPIAVSAVTVTAPSVAVPALITPPLGRQHNVGQMTDMRAGRPGRPRRTDTQRSAATSLNTSHDIFEQALADATSHQEIYDERSVKRTKKRGHALRFVTAGLLGLFLIGFLAFQNAPAISLQIASYRAGLHATLPAEQPAGFNFSYLDYKAGDITANYNSPSDGRQYMITQKSSNWDSQALLSNFVTTANAAYKTYQRAGRTVYLLGNNTATWVDSGIWYTVDGNSSLSSKQVLDLAGSM